MNNSKSSFLYHLPSIGSLFTQQQSQILRSRKVNLQILNRYPNYEDLKCLTQKSSSNKHVITIKLQTHNCITRDEFQILLCVLKDKDGVLNKNINSSTIGKVVTIYCMKN